MAKRKTKAATVEQTKLLSELEEEARIREELPHLFGWPWYRWAWDFYTSTNKVSLLTAANQISKSSTQIRKVIDWATDVSKWGALWKHTVPRNFVYMYPSAKVATVEVDTKWVPDFLPRGTMKDHSRYGWEIIRNTSTKNVEAIRFNSGVTVHFRSYEQSAVNLQTITAHYIAIDEEPPVEIYDECMFRIAGTNGYFSAVFTATKGQDFFRRCMERVGFPDEALPAAWKRQVSAYDCLQYMDGSPSSWTVERIKDLESRCKTPQEVLKRIHGRFVKDDGLRYNFNRNNHVQAPPSGFEAMPRNGHSVYSGVDWGSGQERRSKSSVVFIELDRSMTRVRVFKAWRGDGVSTTAGDLFNKYMELKKFAVTAAKYDPAARDFYEIASRNGEPFFKADKNRQRGDELLNTLFKYDLISIDSGDDELDKLCTELVTVTEDTEKGDDLVDALRYALIDAPINWEAIKPDSGVVTEKVAEDMSELDKRRSGYVTDTIGGFEDDVTAELEAWGREY